MIQTKQKKSYVCSSCGHSSPKWTGQCGSCKKWNTMEETIGEQKRYFIKTVSDKRRSEIELAKFNPDSVNELKEKWFAEVRNMLTGKCQCGCGQPSQKNSDEYFRCSCCHIFPKKTFKSVQYNILNFVERAFFGGCHSQLDDRSLDKWVGMADWEKIKNRFYLLSPLLTEKEKSKKFYTQLENLVKNN